MAKRNPFVFGAVALLIAGLCVIVVQGLRWFHKARNTSAASACINNLRQLDSATQQWALENNKKDDDALDVAAVLKYVKGGGMPVCPHGGTYSLGKTVLEGPRCSILKDNFDWQTLYVADENKNGIPAAIILIGADRYETDDYGAVNTDAEHGVRPKGTFATVFKSGYQTNSVELPTSGAFRIELIPNQQR